MDQEIIKGKILIAMPMLTDPNFRQTIVLLCEHGPEGSLGVVTNRPTEVEVSTLVNDIPDLSNGGLVYAGGPVGRNSMLVLCRGSHPDGRPVLDDIFLAQDLENLKTYGILNPSQEFRYYLGYAGWAPGQLEAEVNAGAWHLMDGNSELVFDANPATVWQEMMRRIGGECAIYSSMPPDLSMN